jgi:hypothetical protein
MISWGEGSEMMFIKSSHNDIEIRIDSGLSFAPKYHPTNQSDIYESRTIYKQDNVCLSIVKGDSKLIMYPFLKDGQFQLTGDLKTLAYHFAILIYDGFSLFTPRRCNI